MNVLELTHLTKSFGANKVISDLSLSVPEHSIFGFLGENGAGKTTTMKMILGLLKPDSGQINVMGEPVSFGQAMTNRHIGYLPDVPEFYSYMKPTEYLWLCGRITGMPKDLTRKRSSGLLDLTGLKNVHKRIGSFSRGMKQRLGIAQALLNEPKLLICDEPTSALDPVGRRDILDILSRIKGQTTVIFSTHILSDAERICDRIAVLHKGNTVLSGTMEMLKNSRRNNHILLEFSDAQKMAEFCKYYPDSLPKPESGSTKPQAIIQTDNAAKTGRIILEILHQNQLFPTKMELLEPTLEDLFMEAVQ